MLIFAYVGEERRMKFNMCLIYLTCEEYIQGPFAFALAVLFAMGYGTRKFRIDASMAWKTLLLTAFNVLLTLPILFREINETWGILDSSLLGGPLAILHCGLIYLCYKIGYNTYEVDRDQRYLDSAKAILFGVFLNTFFIVPNSLWKDGSFMFEHVAGSKDATSEGRAIPDLIEVVVIIYLLMFGEISEKRNWNMLSWRMSRYSQMRPQLSI